MVRGWRLEPRRRAPVPRGQPGARAGSRDRGSGGAPRPDLGAYLFAIVLRGTTTEVGWIVLRVEHEDPGLVAYAGHVGFEVRPSHGGRRHELGACRLLAPLAWRHGFAALWLMTSPDNAASRRTLELLGAVYVDTWPFGHAAPGADAGPPVSLDAVGR